MSMENEDIELARAIEESLRASRIPRNAPIEIIDVDADDDEEFQADIKRALEASTRSVATPVAPLVPDDDKPKPAAPTAFLSERAQMEKARLERQKRLRKEAGLEDEVEEQDDDDDDSDPPPSKRQHISSKSNGTATNGAVSRSAPTASSNPAKEDQLFWAGELRPIACRHAEPRKDGSPTFRLSEILGKKKDISFAILATYSHSIAWIYEFFDPSTPVIFATQGDETGAASIKNVLPNWIKTTPFLRQGRGCMHMKFMLLFYKSGRLRVVISTANLIDFDYRDIENSAWVQDVPLRPTPIPHDPKSKNMEDFPSVMQRVLHAVNVRPALNVIRTEHPRLPLESIEDLRTKWDWSKIKAHLIPSLAGKHEGWPQILHTGHTRLMKALRNLGLRTGKGMKAKQLSIECQGSSIGNYTTQWFNEFHYSARGESAEDWLDESKTKRSKASYPNVKVVFPSLKTVRETVLGEPGGGTIFCSPRQWAGSNFPRQLFHDSKSTGGGVLMHTKMIIGIHKVPSKGKPVEQFDSDSETEDDDDEIVEVNPPIGWAYVGSHNFTPSAWGNLSGSAFNPIMNIANYELGIVFPLFTEEEANGAACFTRPPRKYGASDRPWMQDESEILNAVRMG